MNMLLVITLIVAVPVYAPVWHNQPARTQKGKTTVKEAFATCPFGPAWLMRIAALVRHSAVSPVPPKWPVTKIHSYSRTKF